MFEDLVPPYDKIKAGWYEGQKVELEVKPEIRPDQGLHQTQDKTVDKGAVKVLVKSFKHICGSIYILKKVEGVCSFTNEEDDLIDIVNYG